MATNSQDKGNKQGGGTGASQGSTKNRGFASMDPARQREIASEGGKAAHQKGTAHEFTSEEARRAGSMSHGNRQAAESSERVRPASGAGDSGSGSRERSSGGSGGSGGSSGSGKQGGDEGSKQS